MIKLTQIKTSDLCYKFLDKNENLCGSCFALENDKNFLINPCFPISKKFSKDKMYVCETPDIAKERLEFELNNWLKSLMIDDEKSI